MLRPSKTVSRLQAIKEIDAFSKISDSYVETSALGGVISLIGRFLILVLTITEVMYFNSTRMAFEYDVDRDYDSKLQINLDMTVAMPCQRIQADVMDSTNVHTMETVGETELKHTDVEYDLTEFHTAHWRTRQEVNRYLREEYHAVHETLWHNGYSGSLWGTIADHKQPPLQRAAQLTGCRISGSVMVNKVAGNLHVTMGRHLPHAGGHIHISLFPDFHTNFSHRIERFSFGESSTGIFDPLEGEEKLTNHGNYRYQYYIQVVPTDVVSLSGRVTSTYQYSVTEQQRGIDHESNSHGTPGINFRYQFFPLKVRVIKYTAPQWKFAVRVVAMLGGVHMIIGMVTRCIRFFLDCWKQPSSS